MPGITLASGLTLSYAGRGDADGPVVLMLPGPGDSWRSYQPVLDRLPHDVRAVAVSQRGHGDSDKPERGYRVEDFAADVVSLLDAMEIERAVLAGHSGSCLVARRVALDRPARVAGLILEASPTTLRADPDLSRFVESSVSGLTDPVGAEFARSFVVGTSSQGLEPALVELLVNEVLAVPAHAWKEMFAALLAYDDLPELPLIEAPTLLVWGDADSLIPREMQEWLTRSIPRASLRVHSGAGHTPRWDDPARFAADLAAFALV